MSNNKEVMESDTFMFTWNISNFISRTEEMVNGTYLKSRNFTIKGPGNKSTNMHVNMYPNGYDSESKDYVSVFLFNNDDAGDVFVSCVFSVDTQKSQFDCHEIKANCGFGYHCFIKTNEIASFLSNDTLSLIFEIKVIEKIGKVSIKAYHQDQLSEDLKRLFLNGEYSDMTITCGDRKFECHKNILASRSPVLKAMFETNMKEKNTGTVEIQNMTPEVLEKMLLYMYTGQVPDADSDANELLAAADQYQIGKNTLINMKFKKELPPSRNRKIFYSSTARLWDPFTNLVFPDPLEVFY